MYTYTQKTMGLIEKEAYKVFNFMERAFDLRLLNCVTDWIRDDQGTYWFIGLKSFKLREESYISKTTKPSAFDRELLALNVNKKVAKSKNRELILQFLASGAKNCSSHQTSKPIRSLGKGLSLSRK